MKNRKWKSLLHKAEYLRLDLEEKEDVLKEIESQFVARMSEINPDVNKDGQEQTTGQTQEVSARVNVVDQSETPKTDHLPDVDCDSNKDDDRPENMKRLWKSIAMAVHPDRTGNDAHKTEIYKRAARAWEEKKYDELISIALELHVPFEESDTDSMALLETRIDQMNKRIFQLESSVLWQWHKAPQDKKDAIIKLYLAHKHRKTS
jgi:hypothetical protein